MGAVLNAGIALRWTVKQILGMVSYKDADNAASAVSPGSEGLIFLPYLLGERTPHMDPRAKGIFFGFTLRHGREHMIRAAIEGITFSVKEAIDTIISLGIKPRELIASGGGAESAFWLKLQADIFGIPVIKREIREQAGIGAALLGGIAAGAYSGIADAVSSLDGVGARMIEPDPSNVAVYGEAYEKFKAVYRANKTLF
jgi:xylulokinase